jgi:integrase
LDRNELGAFLVAAGLSSNADPALGSLLALNGLRISGALGADIEHLNVERGHRTLRIVRKGGKQVTIPLAPRTARAIDPTIGEREHGPILLGARSQRLDRYAATRIVKRLARTAGPIIGSHPTACATASSRPLRLCLLPLRRTAEVTAEYHRSSAKRATALTEARAPHVCSVPASPPRRRTSR